MQNIAFHMEAKELTRQLLLPGQEDMSHLFLVWEMMPMQIHL